MSMSDEQARRDMNFWFGAFQGTPTETRPTQVWIALGLNVTGSVGQAELEGGTITEPTGNGYGRVAAVAWTGRNDNLPPNTTADLELKVQTPDPVDFVNDGGGNWGMVNWVAAMTAETGGRIIDFLAMNTPRQINANDTLRFTAGDLTFGRR